MNRIGLVFSVVIMLCFNCMAIDLGGIVKDIPDLKQGIGYSFLDGETSYLSTVVVAEYKDFALEAGYSSRDKIIGVLSIEIIALKDYISIPYLKELEARIGLYSGYGRLGTSSEQNEFDVGASLTILEIGF